MTIPLKEIRCYADTKIYVFCPAGYATGGPEALHQLAHHLNLFGFNALICYYDIHPGNPIVHPNYQKYNVPYVTEPENDERHIIVVPETHLSPIFDKKLNRIRKAIWWLSVTNYYIILQMQADSARKKRFYGLRRLFGEFKALSFERLKEKNVLHIGHSWFSMVHLRENGIEPVGQISDYMNNAFFENVHENTIKEDIIIYNPKKNDAFLNEIIRQTPSLNWKPLEGMTPQEVAGWMNRAKLYIDFGYHPGKERMPREACIMRCCMIIGKTGSAAYAEDMPIPEKYRFEKKESNIQSIITRINDCLENYDQRIGDFEAYRKELFREKEKFISDIQKVFIRH